MSPKLFTKTDLERAGRLAIQIFEVAGDREESVAEAVKTIADTSEPVYTLDQIERALAAALRALNP